MEILISALVGGVITLIISLVFEAPLVTAKRRFVKWFLVHEFGKSPVDEVISEVFMQCLPEKSGQNRMP